MKTSLPQAQADYAKHWMQQVLNRLSDLFDACFRRGQDLRLENGERLIIKDRVTGQRWDIYVSSGVVNIEEVT